MLRNKLDLLSGNFSGLNMNPIPLEFNQGMTTTKWLLGLLAKVDEVIKFTNEWYDEIVTDLTSDGVLFNHLKDGILVDLTNTINNMNTSIIAIESDITNLENADIATNNTLSSHTAELANHVNEMLAIIAINDTQTANITNNTNSINNINTNLADKETRLANAINNLANLQTLYSTIDTSVQSLLNQIGTKADASATNYAISQMVTKVAGKGLSSNDYTSIDKSEVAKVSNKADLSYVNDKINSIVSGTPSGVYATLALLQTAYPSGNGTKIYIVSADGKWYYWNGTAWTAGGQYQSTGLVAGSITPDLLSFNPLMGSTTKNLFNKLTVTAGYYVYFGNGTLMPSASYSASAFIPVAPNTIYTKNLDQQFAYYDVNKNYITTTDNTTVKTFTTPANCGFVRLSVQNVNLGTLQLEKGDTATAYIGFGPNFDQNCIANFITYDKLDPLLIKGELSKNIFDKSTVTHGFYVNFASGNLVATPPSPLYSVSAYIPVKAGVIYTKNYIEQFAFYDINKVVIPQTDNTNVTTFTTPSNCAYVRLSIQDQNINNLQLEEGNVATVYTPYGTVLNSAIGGAHYQDTIIVAKSGGDYDTLEEAITNAKDTANYKVTIKIMAGTYKGSFDIRGRNLSLIGADKYACIIRNDSGNYYTPPLNISGGGIHLANLTIISTHDDGTPYTVPSYGIHCDADGEGVTEIENCIIRSRQHAGLGIGLHNNQKLIVNNCEIYKDDISCPVDGGGIYIHNQQYNGATNQKFILKNSTVKCDTGRAIVIQDANHRAGGAYGDSKDTVFTFYNNVLWSNVYKKNNPDFGDTPLVSGAVAGYIMLGEDSYGNNLSFFNK